MSRATMAAAAAALPRSDLYGIGACRVGAEIRDFEIGWDEVERDASWVAKVLRSAGLSAGDLALVTLPNWEGPWFSPAISALRRLKVVYTLAENYSWDARRAAHLIRSLKPKAYVGLCSDTLDGFKAQGDDVAELLAGIEVIWTRHDALAAMTELGIQAQTLCPLGPALAIGIPGVGAVVNADEWDLRTIDGEFVVSSAAERATRFADLATGVRGHITAQSEFGTVVAFDI